MRPAQVLDTCLTCHSKDISRANIRRSIAHSGGRRLHQLPLHSQIARCRSFCWPKQQTQLCYTCHAPVRAQFEMPVKTSRERRRDAVHRLPQPARHVRAHMAHRTGRALVTTALDNEEPCLKCHTDKRGPFVFEHAGARGRLRTCHMPHGSTKRQLLRRPVVFTLCLECHNGAGTFGLRKQRHTTAVRQRTTCSIRDTSAARLPCAHSRLRTPIQAS